MSTPTPAGGPDGDWRYRSIHTLAARTYRGVRFSVHACAALAAAGCDTLGVLADRLTGRDAGAIPPLPSGDWHTLPVALEGAGVHVEGVAETCGRLADEARIR